MNKKDVRKRIEVDRNVSMLRNPKTGRVGYIVQVMVNGRRASRVVATRELAIALRNQWRHRGVPAAKAKATLEGKTAQPAPSAAITDITPTALEPVLTRLGIPTLRIPLRIIESPCVYIWLGPDGSVRYAGVGRHGIKRPLQRDHHIAPKLRPEDELVVWTFDTAEEAVQAEMNILAAIPTALNIRFGRASMYEVSRSGPIP
jgi:hypothetical protein